ncbi:uncharacterized protein LOC144633749 isoform X2 [Oculina patagonica]
MAGRKGMKVPSKHYPFNAIFAVKEVFEDGIYQTRGMACAVVVGGSERLLTWSGVIEESDCNKLFVMDRFSDKSTEEFLSNRERYRLQNSKTEENGNLTFFSVNAGDKASFTTLDLKVPQSDISLQTSDFTAYTFSGKEKLNLNFKYDSSKKKHNLVSGNWTKRAILEKSSVIGSPIMVDEDNNRKVVGVVGEIGGKLSPCFVTEKQLNGQGSNPTEGVNSKSSQDGQSSSGSGAAKFGQGSNPTEGVNSNSSQNGQSTSGLGQGSNPTGVNSNSSQDGQSSSGLGAATLVEPSEDKTFCGKTQLVTGHKSNPKGVNGNSSQQNGSSSSTDEPDAKIVEPSEDKTFSGKAQLVTGHKSNPKGVNGNSSQQNGSSSSTDEPDAKIGFVPESSEKGSEQESSEQVRSGAVPLEYLPYLALDIQGKVKWEIFGRSLGLTEADLNSIKHDNDEEYERYYKMLVMCYQQKGGASYKVLTKALQDHKLHSIREDYCLEEHDPPTRKNPVKLENVKSGSISDLVSIADAVKGKRKRLGRALGLTDDQVGTIVEENRGKVEEQSYQILLKWKSAKGRNATYIELAQALIDRTVDMRTVMEEHCLKSKSG